MTPQGSPTGPREYSEQSPRRHAAPTTSNRSRRSVYFVLAAGWGFVVGVAGLLAALSLAGQTAEPAPGLVVGLVPPLIVALVGGLVVARAYQEAKRGRR